MRFKDKIVFITGSSRGIGKASALGFAQEGATVIINYINSDDAANQLVADIKQSGSSAIAIKCDVSDENQVKQAIDKIVSEYGRIDILVNNAAIVSDVPLFEKTVDQWQATLATNLIGPFLTSKCAAKYLRQSKGKIINVCSTSGYTSFDPTSADYDASKVGLISLTKNLAKELAPEVNVNGVAPGWVDTDMNKDLPSDYVADQMKNIILGRMAKPEEVAQSILFLASDEASFITGSILTIDGGKVY
jgi:3-oxoacyl-[acyl-carrier protein] reductase